ncbi:unnamed protein product [Caenorhabditis angaria]|uniref:Uncharacterized protein n=1 Tax=Caenorhabditis angaria TaxID=860376 RepID=A0A9P1I5V0_9PELO|nr:unnamed protein product [Caenorhabditis angaria]
MSSSDIHCSTSDSSDPSFGSSSEEGEPNMLSEGSDFVVIPSSESDSGNIVGPPPIDFSDDEEYHINHMNSDSDNDEYDPNFDAAAYYEAVPDNIYSGNVVNEEDQLNLNDYTDQNIKSLLSSILLSDGSKAKIGYTAEEVSFMAEKMLQLNLSQITQILMGSNCLESLATKSKVDMAHDLVQNNWLIFNDGKFFPKIDHSQTEIVKQIIRGAEAEQRRVEQNKKVTAEFESAEIEIRAMKTYNYLIALISRVCNDRGRGLVSYQMLIDAHNEILEGTNYNDISQKFVEKLNLKDHGAWSADWFKHFTSRSSLKKFVKMSQFSGIKTDLIENKPMFGLRDTAKLFGNEDFANVRQKWTIPDDRKNRNYSRDQRQPRRKTEEEPDENYEPRNFKFDDSDDDYEEDRNRNRNQSNQPPARFIGSAFGGPPIQPAEKNPVKDEPSKKLTNCVENTSSTRQVSSNDVDLDLQEYLTSSDDTGGFFSDDSDATKQQKTQQYERKKDEKERKKLLRKEKGEEKKQAAPPVRAFLSAWGSSDNEETIENNSSNNTKKSYASTSALPVTSVNSDSNLLGKSTRPQVPHEPSGVQLQKNREEEGEISRRRMNQKREEENEDVDEKTKEYGRRQKKQREEDKKKILEEERIVRENEERKRKEIEEKKRQEKEDEEFARKVQDEEKGLRTWDGNDYDRHHFEPPQTGKFGSSRQDYDPSPPLISERGSTSRHHSSRYEDTQNHGSSRQHPTEMRDQHRRDNYTPSNRSRRVSPDFEPKAFHSYVPQNHQVHRPQPTHGNDRYFADYSSSSYPAQYNPQNYSQPPIRQSVTNNRCGSTSSNQGFGSFAAERDRVHANMSRNSNFHDGLEALRDRIHSFIIYHYKHNEVVTENYFYQTYPYRLPEGFNFHDFVLSNMKDLIIIRGNGSLKVYDPLF